MKKSIFLTIFALSPLCAAQVEEKVVEVHMIREAVYLGENNFEELSPFPGKGTCSGAFISNKGDIITAKHCVDGVKEIEVQTFDRQSYKAVIVSTSIVHDLALIHIDRRNTPYFVLASSITRGERITTIGSPLAITDTMSVGIVARIDGDILLVDCSVIPGNSGGPIFNAKEELVGIASAGFVVMQGVTHLNIAQGIDAIYFFLQEELK